MNNGLNPWADAMLGQLLTCRLVFGVALKTCDPQNWVNVDAVPDACLPRREPRLNPLEFHGRRRSSAVPQRDDAANQPSARRSTQVYRRVRL